MRVNVNGEWLNIAALDALAISKLDVTESTCIQLLQAWIRGQEQFTFHTSGSTGTPKPVTFHRRQLEASANLSISTLSLKPGMKSLACLDPRFVAGAMMVIRSAIAGMDMIVRKPSAHPFADLDIVPDFAALVPLQLLSALKENPKKLAAMSVVIIGGAPLEESVITQLDSYSTKFYATYGMTETLTHIALRKLNGADKQDCYHLLPGVSGASDDRGCLIINASHLGPEPIATNDLVEWYPGGGFRLTGRYDDVINSGGVKIHPGRVELVVEQAMKQLGLRCRYFVAGLPDERLHEAVVLVFEGSPLPLEVESELSNILNARLNRHEVPKRFLYSPHFEETATQKVDKRTTLKFLDKKTT